MTWKDDLQAAIEGRWAVGTSFTLDEIYALEDQFSRTFPANNTVRESLRRNLQELRDDGIIEFVDDQGQYRRCR
jgi:hypothetical protein